MCGKLCLYGGTGALVGFLSWFLFCEYDIVTDRFLMRSSRMIKNMRLSKGWSQEQLADFSGLSVRTVQRLERGHSTGLESLNCIAAVLEV